MDVVAYPLEKNAGWPGEEEAAVSSQAEENKTLVLRFLEARVEPELDALDTMLAPDFVSHTKLLPGQPPDREGYKWSPSFLPPFQTSASSSRSRWPKQTRW